MVRQLHQRVVAKLGGIAEVSQRVFRDLAVDARALQVGEALRQRGVGVDQRGGVLVEQAGLADQVEAVVGQGQVFFKDRTVAAPLGVALAQHDGVVGQVQDVIHGCVDRHHMCPTLSGIS